MGELEPNHASVGDLARKLRGALGAALMSVALAACGGGDGDSPAAGGTNAGPGVGHAGSVAGDSGAAVTGGAAVVADGGVAAGGSGAAASGSAAVAPDTGVAAGGSGAAATGGAATTGGSAAVAPDSGAWASGGGAPVSDSGAVASDGGGVPVASAPGATTLSWIPPTMNADGTPLKLTGYRIYWGQTKDHFPYSITLKNPGLTRYVVEQLAPATWYFVATALSESGESEFSNVLAMQVR